MNPYLYTGVILYLVLLSAEAAGAAAGDIGAIVNYKSRVAKEQVVAANMAIQDYYYNNTAEPKPLLHIRDIGSDNATATLAAIELIKKTKVGVVLSFMMSEDFAFIAELGTRAQVPILSFSDSTRPVWVREKWPFLIQATHKDYNQMKAMASIIKTWEWPSVSVIYQDDNIFKSSIIYLANALKEVGSQVDQFLALPPINFSISQEVEKLKHRQCRVFIVHTSLSVAEPLFKEAKKMNLMGNDSAWIVTNAITDLLDVVNTSLTSTMQGILGIKTFVQNGAELEYFQSRFRSKFRSEHPEEEFWEPTIYALEAYDAVWAVAQATEGRTNTTISESVNPVEVTSPFYGKALLDKLLLGRLEGLTGEFHFEDGELVPSRVFGIVNVFGKSYRELCYWNESRGFFLNTTEGSNSSTSIERKVLWPEGNWSKPRGWASPMSETPLKIGVPYNNESSQWINVVEIPGGKPIVSGFSVLVFEAVERNLRYALPKEWIPFRGTYHELIANIYYKKYDAVVGDTAILENRSEHADFSQPWADSGVQMVVLKKSIKANMPWLFAKPFTNTMWASTAGITIYNGFIVWLVEHTHHPEFNGSPWNKFGALMWLAVSSLFSLHGEKLHTNLSRMTMMVWIFVAIIIIQSYTASLTTMLTVSHFKTDSITVESLKMENAKVGCDGRSFVVNYLEQVLKFKQENIMGIPSKDGYFEALRSGKIKAVFLEVAYIKIFEKEYCNEFAVIGETFKIGGFGFAFRKGSQLLSDINKALLKVKESGDLEKLEKTLTSSYNCSASSDDEDSLDVNSFGGLFVITGGTSTIALLLHLLWRRRAPGSLVHATLEDDPGTHEAEHDHHDSSKHEHDLQDIKVNSSDESNDEDAKIDAQSMITLGMTNAGQSGETT